MVWLWLCYADEGVSISGLQFAGVRSMQSPTYVLFRRSLLGVERSSGSSCKKSL